MDDASGRPIAPHLRAPYELSPISDAYSAHMRDLSARVRAGDESGTVSYDDAVDALAERLTTA